MLDQGTETEYHRQVIVGMWEAGATLRQAAIHLRVGYGYARRVLIEAGFDPDEVDSRRVPPT